MPPLATALWNTSLADFRDATASPEPTPGGGSVAAVSAALGLGLVIMALEISVRRKDASHIETTHALLDQARTLLAQLTSDADSDILAFQAYMAALKLPKQSDQEKRERKEALQLATRGATEAPLQAARHILHALEIAQSAIPLTHIHVLSDVGAGAALLQGASTAVLLNVDINLPSITDPAIRSAAAAERSTLATRATALATHTLAAVSAFLSPPESA